ncbi:MAG: DUF362 domain-containing protein [Candidatus Thorarchaeota archaeon]
MNDLSDLKNTELAIVKGDTPKETVLKGIEILGGINKFIEEGDQVFIKFNLCLPSGFPANINFDVLESVITSCNKAGANNIRIGSYPFKGVSINTISNLLNLKEYFNKLGTEIAFLDNSDVFKKKNIKRDQLNGIKNKSFSKMLIKEKEYLVPKIITNSDKFIIVNQVNVNPLFKLNLSLLNLYSIIPPKYQDIRRNESQDNDYISSDQYKKDIISNILDVLTIKQPDLVINDFFFLLERAGPYIYVDSNLKKTGIIIVGNNAVSVDLITLKLLNIEGQNDQLILKANQRGLGIIDLQKIKILGEKIEDNKVDIDLCVSKLEDIKLKNIVVNTGRYCSGCFKQAYHLLNFMKTYMTKDLKYNPNNAFLVGQNPLEPDHFNNILLFGDCAITSNKNSNFRKIKKISKKKVANKKKSKKLQKYGFDKTEKIKYQTNKKILELPGCPPDILNCLELIIKHYGKSNLPNLSFFWKLLAILVNPKEKEKLRVMGVI